MPRTFGQRDESFSGLVGHRILDTDEKAAGLLRIFRAMLLGDELANVR
jgi:hypothetical protein